MATRQYFAKAKEYVRDFHELNGTVAEYRLRSFKRAVYDGTLEKILKVSIPVTGALTIIGITTSDEVLRGIGEGGLIMSLIYSLALLRNKQTKK